MLSLDKHEQIPGILRAIRTHLGMDVAFVSEFADGRRVFRHVDSPYTDQPVKAGNSDPLEETYCLRVVDGRLPERISDTAGVPAALELPVTRALPVGAHMSVPIKLKDGRIYGTFCCFSFAAHPTLNDRDLQMMRVFADLAGDQIERTFRPPRREPTWRVASTPCFQATTLPRSINPSSMSPRTES